MTTAKGDSGLKKKKVEVGGSDFKLCDVMYIVRQPGGASKFKMVWKFEVESGKCGVSAGRKCRTMRKIELTSCCAQLL